jgi:hypothetical protein
MQASFCFDAELKELISSRTREDSGGKRILPEKKDDDEIRYQRGVLRPTWTSVACIHID